MTTEPCSMSDPASPWGAPPRGASPVSHCRIRLLQSIAFAAAFARFSRWGGGDENAAGIATMSLFDIFRGRAIIDLGTLGAFIEEQSMSLAEQPVQNYTSQRAGPHAQAVFADAAFRAALEQARSEAYPLALAMVAELAGAFCGPTPERTNRGWWPGSSHCPSISSPPNACRTRGAP